MTGFSVGEATFQKKADSTILFRAKILLYFLLMPLSNPGYYPVIAGRQPVTF